MQRQRLEARASDEHLARDSRQLIAVQLKGPQVLQLSDVRVEVGNRIIARVNLLELLI